MVKEGGQLMIKIGDKTACMIYIAVNVTWIVVSVLAYKAAF